MAWRAREIASLHDGANKMSLCILPEKPFHRSLPIANPSIPTLFSFFSLSSPPPLSRCRRRRRRRRLFVVPRLNPNRTWHDFQPRKLHREPLVIKASDTDDRVNERARRRAQPVQRRIYRRLYSLSRGREIISLRFTQPASYCVVSRGFTNVIEKLSRSPLLSNLVEFSFDLKI